LDKLSAMVITKAGPNMLGEYNKGKIYIVSTRYGDALRYDLGKTKKYINITDTNLTLEEAIIKSYTTRSSRHKYELVRSHAHRLSKHMKWATKICQKCNWDKHTELCHIKPISLFSLSTKLEEINSKENIIFLCPNCHWTLDNT
jgi:predicted HNH restriction endonuclease